MKRKRYGIPEQFAGCRTGPGMEVGSRKDPYNVLLIDKAGRSSVFAAYPKS